MPTIPQPENTVVVKSVTETIGYRLTLTARQANALYNEAYRLQRDADRGHPFRESWPTLALIYDGLYAAGCDGSD